jgi:hypothetical protein
MAVGNVTDEAFSHGLETLGKPWVIKITHGFLLLQTDFIRG